MPVPDTPAAKDPAASRSVAGLSAAARLRRLSTAALSARWLMAISAAVLATMLIASLATLPYTLGRSVDRSMESARAVDAAHTHMPRRYEAGDVDRALLPPFWAPHRQDELQQIESYRQQHGFTPRPLLGTDRIGRDVFIRLLAGGGVSLTIGLAAAAITTVVGTIYGLIAGWLGGRVDAVMMRIVDILYGLPAILLVVLMAVAVDGLLERVGGRVSPETRAIVGLMTLLIAIGGVSWLTMARVIRGQVLSLKRQPFMEACIAIGVPMPAQVMRHLLPNLTGPIVVYATLAVPTAILAESFLSFLGIGVREPLPSWGNLAADGLSELNVVRSRWWLLLWPCMMIAITLLALNFLGEGLSDKLGVRRSIVANHRR